MNDFENMGFTGESPVNYEQKVPCILVLDVSGSMAGEPIRQLNQGLKTLQQDLQNNLEASQKVEVSIVTFGSTVNIVQEFKLSAEFDMPTLTTSGSTKLVDGMRMAINQIESRKSWYKATGQTYLRPWIMLITDGEPDPDQNLAALSSEIREKVDNKAFVFFAIGVEGYNHAKLAQICHPNTPPLKLKGLEFSSLFTWLSASLSIVSQSKEGQKVTFAPTSSWTQIEI